MRRLLDTFRSCIALDATASKTAYTIKRQIRKQLGPIDPSGLSNCARTHTKAIVRRLSRHPDELKRILNAEADNYEYQTGHAHPPLYYYLSGEGRRVAVDEYIVGGSRRTAERSYYVPNAAWMAACLFNCIAHNSKCNGRPPKGQQAPVGALTPVAREYLAELGFVVLNGGLCYLRQTDAVVLPDGTPEGEIVHRSHIIDSPKFGIIRRSALRRVVADPPIKNTVDVDGVPHLPLSAMKEYGLYLEHNVLYPARHKYTAPIDNSRVREHGGSSRSGAVRFIGKRHTDGVRIGFEWEMEVSSNRVAAATGRRLATLFNTVTAEPYISIEKDGSLNRGFELVSSNTSSGYHISMLRKMESKLAKLSDSRNPFLRLEKARLGVGGHIHIDKRHIKNEGMLLYFVNTEAKKCESAAVPHNTRYAKLFGREPTRYCKGIDYEGKVRSVTNTGSRKYVACTDCPTKTIELRAFRYPDSIATMIVNIKTVEALVEWTNQLVTYNPKRLTMHYFVDFLNKQAGKYQSIIDRIHEGENNEAST